MQVYFYEAFEEEQELLKQHLPPNIDAGFSRKTIQEEQHQKPPADVISIRTQSKLPLAWSPQLKGVLSRSTGYDHLIQFRTQSKNNHLELGYLPVYCHRAVAEQAIMMAMALMRKLPQQMQQFYRFERDGLSGSEVQGKKLIVVGVGNIGYQVVNIGRSLGMETLGVDIVQRHDDVSYIDTDVALQLADIIVCAMNLTEQNKAYFNLELFKTAVRQPVFINIARGEMSPIDDVLKALKKGYLRGAALDVYEDEPILAHDLRAGVQSNQSRAEAVMQLAQRKDVILTPHNAFNTIEAVQRKARQAIEQIQHFIDEGAFKWTVPDQF